MVEPIPALNLYNMVVKYVSGLLSRIFFSFRSWFFDELYYPIDYSQFKQLLEEYKKALSGLSYKYEVFDCIAPDTPIIVTKPNDMPDIVTPEDLMPTDSPELGQPYYLTDVAILSHYDGVYGLVWTKLNWVMAKKTNKKQYNVVGIVPIKVTEDHRVLGRWGKVVGQEIKIDHPNSKSDFTYVSNIVEKGKVGKENLYPFWFKVVPIEKAFYSNIHIDPDLAWVWGYFTADGAVLRRRGSPHEVYFYTTEQKIADKLVNILNDHYKGFEWVVSEVRKAGVKTNVGVVNKPLLRVRARVKRVGESLKMLAKEFNSKFYTRGGLKKVPKDVLNADVETVKAFLDGYIAGDGTFNESKNVYEIDTNSRPLALGIYVLTRKLGIYPRIYYTHKGDREYVHIDIPNNNSKPVQFDTLHLFKRAMIHESVNHEPIVYDLNTDTHMFVAGGQVVHNCDDFSEFFAVWMKLRTNTNGCGMAIGFYNGYGHAWNVCLVNDGGTNKIVFVEPQSGNEVSVGENYKLTSVVW